MPGAPEGAAFSQPTSSWVCSPPSWNTCPAPAPPSPTILRDPGQEALRSPLRQEPPTHPLQPTPPAHRNTRKKTETSKTRGCSSPNTTPQALRGAWPHPPASIKQQRETTHLGLRELQDTGSRFLASGVASLHNANTTIATSHLQNQRCPGRAIFPEAGYTSVSAAPKVPPVPKALLAFGCCAVLQAAQAPILSRRRPRSSPLPFDLAAALLGRAGREDSLDGSPHPRPGLQPPRTGPCDLCRKARGLPPASAQQRHCGGCVPSPRRGLFADDSLAAPRLRPGPRSAPLGIMGASPDTSSL